MSHKQWGDSTPITQTGLPAAAPIKRGGIPAAPAVSAPSIIHLHGTQHPISPASPPPPTPNPQLPKSACIEHVPITSPQSSLAPTLNTPSYLHQSPLLPSAHLSRFHLPASPISTRSLIYLAHSQTRYLPGSKSQSDHTGREESERE